MAALKGHEDHVEELKLIIKAEPDGPAKKELTKVRDNAKKHVKELEDHISQGKKLVDSKESQLDKINTKVTGATQVDVSLAKQLKKDKDNEKSAADQAEESASLPSGDADTDVIDGSKLPEQKEILAKQEAAKKALVKQELDAKKHEAEAEKVKNSLERAKESYEKLKGL